MALYEIEDQEAPPHDIRKFVVLSRITSTRRVLFTRSNGSIKSMKDVLSLNRPIKVITSSGASSSHLTNLVIWRVIGAEIKFITGYKGSADMVSAILPESRPPAAAGEPGGFLSADPAALQRLLLFHCRRSLPARNAWENATVNRRHRHPVRRGYARCPKIMSKSAQLLTPVCGSTAVIKKI